jgi:hypothetical protein
LICLAGLVVMLVAAERGDDSTSAPPARRPVPAASHPGNAAGGAVPRDELTGFGERIETWRRSHVADGNPYVPGTSYDANRFGEVFEQDGRIMGFDINYSRRGVALAVARADARGQLPGDATTMWSKTLDECLVQQLRSATLALILYPRWMPTRGDVQVRYAFDDLEPSLEASRVVSITIITDYTEEVDFTAC